MNLAYFIARRVATSGQQSFSRLIIRIAVVAVALSVAVMIAATALIAGFKREISSKIFGFWGHIHITDTDVSQNLIDSRPVRTSQAFYPDLDTVRRISFSERKEIFGRQVERVRETKGGIRHVQVYALNPGIIKSRQEIEGIILKGVGRDFDWSFMQQ